MTDTDKAVIEATDDIEKQLNTILPGSDPLDGLDATHEGGLEYSVMSVRDGAPSIHWVTLGENPTCTCADFHGNRKTSFTEDFGDREPCTHIAKAYLTDTMDPEQLAVRELINVTATVSEASREAREAAREARDAATEIENGLVHMRAHEADQAASDPSPESSGTSGSTEPSGPNAADKADELQAAYDAVVEGFEVEVNEGVLWVNKTPEAPDTLPGPGNIDLFSTFFQNPDQIEYVHENHDYDGAQPGQYFKNMIRTENVDDYISEVLQ